MSDSNVAWALWTGSRTLSDWFKPGFLELKVCGPIGAGRTRRESPRSWHRQLRSSESTWRLKMMPATEMRDAPSKGRAAAVRVIACCHSQTATVVTRDSAGYAGREENSI